MDSFLIFLLGLGMLVAGGEALVRGSVTVAQALRISPFVIGLTLVGFGTSAPELVTSLQAALTGSPGIAVGNVVGSNIANILLILGLAAAVRPIAVAPEALRRDGAVMALATALCVALALVGEVGRLAGGALALALAVYLVTTLMRERGNGSAAGDLYAAEAGVVAPVRQGIGLALALAVLGLALTIFGARFLVEGAVALATLAGVSEAVIGLTIVAVGTSMPELVTAVVAVRRGQGDVAFGNILGSNIFNILGILGITALIVPLPVPAEIARADIWILAAVTLGLAVFARTGWRLSRREGAAFLAAYLVYLVVLATR